MANKLKFHLDESVSNAIAKGLRMRGIDITTSPEEGLIGASDKEQLAYALSQGRVVFTFDDDFLVLSSMGLEHCDQDLRKRPFKKENNATGSVLRLI